MAEVNGVFANEGVIEPAPWGGFGTVGRMDPAPFHSPIDNYYLTDPISRASETMAQCAGLAAGAGGKTGTDG